MTEANMAMSGVRSEKRGTIVILTIDNPPVNALSAHIRRQLRDLLFSAQEDPEVSGIVLHGAGRVFVAGADITELGTPKQTEAPTLPDLCAYIEAQSKPVMAAIHGMALGGGLELALACPYRMADSSAKLGLPEVSLGFIPGSGGTVRLPRIVGPETALQMIVSGKPITDVEALKNGLVDEISNGNLVDDASSFLKDKLGSSAVPVKDRNEKLDMARSALDRFDEFAATLTRRSRGLLAPLAAANAVRNSITMSFDAASELERETFLRLLNGAESKALRHLFFAEREAAKTITIGQPALPREVKRVGVIGAGTMGGGIAMAFVNAGLPVALVEMNSEALLRGMSKISDNYQMSVSRGSISAAEREERVARISGSTDFASLTQCDLIVEAVFEDLATKKDVMAKLDAVAKPGSVLATNTSYLDVNAIAAATRRPEDVVGLHFFSPANVMKLLEIVQGAKTRPEVIATALQLARTIKKTPVVVGVCHGFVGNRMLAARGMDNEEMLLEGASPEQIDAAFREFGWPMGPFEMSDLAGLDISWRTRKAQGRQAAIADALCEQGRFGQKAGRGYYRYDSGSRTPLQDDAVMELIESVSIKKGYERRTFTTQEIIERTLFPMINEGVKILNEGIAMRRSDIDVVWVNGYGFPAAKGGPMHWAREFSEPQTVYNGLRKWHERSQRSAFEPAANFLDILG